MNKQMMPCETAVMVEPLEASHHRVTSPLANRGMTPHGGERPPRRNIDPTAVIARDVDLGLGVTVGPRVTIAEGAVIGDGVRIDAGCYIGARVRIGEDSVIAPQVAIRDECVLGKRVRVASGAVIGSDGFGFAPDANGRLLKMPQVGYVAIGDDSVIGSGATIDRATMGATRLGKRVTIGSLVQIGHNVTVGDDSVIGSLTGICGSTEIGCRVRLGAHCAVTGHLTVGDDVTVHTGGGVAKSVKPGQELAGAPALPIDQARKVAAAVRDLPELLSRMRHLEKCCNGKLEAAKAARVAKAR